MSVWFIAYMVGVILVGGFFLGVAAHKPDKLPSEVGLAVVFGLIWPMTVVGLAFAALFKWAERVSK